MDSLSQAQVSMAFRAHTEASWLFLLQELSPGADLPLQGQQTQPQPSSAAQDLQRENWETPSLLAV